jgi:peptidoglycan/LPS O-acetylase OafA/YrhL
MKKTILAEGMYIQSNYRNQRIDFLRGVAIIAVLILHFHLSYHLDQSALGKIFSPDFIKTMAGNGNYGVIIFFVISGFLITSTAFARYGELGKIDVIGFYVLRFARIMPCLLLAIALILLFSFSPITIFKNHPNTASMPLAVFSIFTFWHNVLMEKAGYFNYCLNIYWSLSVEEVFYIAFPILCLLFKRTRLLVPCWLALIIIAPIYRSYHAQNEIIALYGYLSCFDAIAIGCCAAVIARKIQLQGRMAHVIQYGAVFLLVSVYLWSRIMENIVFGVTLVAIATAILLIGAKSEGSKQVSSANSFSSVVRWFGKNSYELYLFHIIVLALMRSLCPPGSLGSYSQLLWMVVFFAASALVAGSIAKFYSQPMNQKIRELFFRFAQSNRLPSVTDKKIPML